MPGQAERDAGRRAGVDEVAGVSTMNWLRYQTMCATVKIMSAVRAVLPRIAVDPEPQRRAAADPPPRPAVTSYGPSGLKVSQLLPLSHWPPRSSWNSRSETSWETTYPAM